MATKRYGTGMKGKTGRPASKPGFGGSGFNLAKIAKGTTRPARTAVGKPKATPLGKGMKGTSRRK